jgi:hypothetical protein
VYFETKSTYLYLKHIFSAWQQNIPFQMLETWNQNNLLKHVCIRSFTALASGLDRKQHCRTFSCTVTQPRLRACCDSHNINAPSAVQFTSAVLLSIQVSYDVTVCCWRVIADVSKYRSAFIFKGWSDEGTNDISKRWRPITKRHLVTSQETQIVTTVPSTLTAFTVCPRSKQQRYIYLQLNVIDQTQFYAGNTTKFHFCNFCVVSQP